MKQKINFVAIAVAILLFELVVCQDIIIFKLKGDVDDSQGYIDYWRLKVDSLSDANHQLHMQWFDMRDSLAAIKYKLDHQTQKNYDRTYQDLQDGRGRLPRPSL